LNPGQKAGDNQFPGNNWFTWITYDKVLGGTQEYPIYAGQHNLAGTLYVKNVGGLLQVKFTTVGAEPINGAYWFGFSEYHVQVDCSQQALYDAVTNNKGNPVPGRCEYKGTFSTLQTDTDWLPVPGDDVSGCGDTIYIFAHGIAWYGYLPPGP